MNSQIRTKPKSLLLIGWFLIIVAAFSIVSGINGLLYYTIDEYRNAYESAFMPENSNESIAIPHLFSKSLSIALTIFGLAYNIVLLVSSVQFLKLKEWARKTLEILTWIYIAEMLIGAILFAISWSDKLFEPLKSMSDIVFGNALIFIIKIIVYICIVVIVAVAGIIIWLLKSDKVKNAMQPSVSIVAPIQLP